MDTFWETPWDKDMDRNHSLSPIRWLNRPILMPIATYEKGSSAHELHRESAMKQNPFEDKLNGVVDDETCIGGKHHGTTGPSSE